MPVISLTVTLETHRIVIDMCFYLYLPCTNMTQYLTSQPAAWQLPDLIFQRLRIDLYKFALCQSKHQHIFTTTTRALRVIHISQKFQ